MEAVDESIKKATRDRINRQARIIADDMVSEDDAFRLTRMNGAMAILNMAIGMSTDQQANLLIDKARKLTNKKS